MKPFAISVLLTASFVFSACTGSSPPNVSVPANQNSASATGPGSPAPAANAATSVAGAPSGADSKYTSIAEGSCKDINPGPDDSGIIYKASCPGESGYKIIVMSTDHTSGLEITDPSGKAKSISFREVVGSSLDLILGGDKLEWRYSKGLNSPPNALIVRMNQRTDPADETKVESHLVVIKLTPEICITDLIKQSVKDQNVKAREAADASGYRPCMPTIHP